MPPARARSPRARGKASPTARPGGLTALGPQAGFALAAGVLGIAGWYALARRRKAAATGSVNSASQSKKSAAQTFPLGNENLPTDTLSEANPVLDVEPVSDVEHVSDVENVSDVEHVSDVENVSDTEPVSVENYGKQMQIEQENDWSKRKGIENKIVGQARAKFIYPIKFGNALIANPSGSNEYNPTLILPFYGDTIFSRDFNVKVMNVGKFLESLRGSNDEARNLIKQIENTYHEDSIIYLIPHESQVVNQKIREIIENQDIEDEAKRDYMTLYAIGDISLTPGDSYALIFNEYGEPKFFPFEEK